MIFYISNKKESEALEWALTHALEDAKTSTDGKRHVSIIAKMLARLLDRLSKQK